MKEIKIENFITIRALELNKEDYVCFVDNFNEKYFYIDNNNELCTHQSDYAFYKLYFQKATIIYCDTLDKIEKDVYELYRQLTFSIPRAKRNAKYYFIDMNFEVQECEERNDYADNIIYNSFNYFVSEEEAEKYADTLQKYLIELRKEKYINGEYLNGE